MNGLREFMAGLPVRPNPPTIAESLGRILRPPRDAERVAAVEDVVRRFDRQRRAGRDLEEALVIEGLLPESWPTPVRWASRYSEPANVTVAHFASLAAFAPALTLALPLVEEYRQAAQVWFGRPIGEGVWLDPLRHADVTVLARHLPLKNWTFLFDDCAGEEPAPLVTVAALNGGLSRAIDGPGPAEEMAAEGGLRWCETQALRALVDAEMLARARAARLRVPEGARSGYNDCAVSGMRFRDLPDPGRPLWEVWLTGFSVLRVYPGRPGPGIALGMPPLEAPGEGGGSPEIFPQGR